MQFTTDNLTHYISNIVPLQLNVWTTNVESQVINSLTQGRASGFLRALGAQIGGGLLVLLKLCGKPEN